MEIVYGALRTVLTVAVVAAGVAGGLVLYDQYLRKN